jgi:FkbM family methyltransferase
MRRPEAGVNMLGRLGYELLHKVDLRIGRLLGRGFAGSKTIDFEVAQARGVLSRDAGWTLIDAGANVGEWTKAFLKLGGSAVEKVYMFEPDMANADKLKSIDDKRVRICSEGLWRESGERELYSECEGSRLASFYRRKLDHHHIDFAVVRKVRTVSLDEFLDRENIEVVDFMKLDIEGGEFDVLEGGIESLRGGKVLALSFEFGGCNIDSRTYLRDFWFFLDDLRFSLYIVNPLTGLFPITRYHERDENFLTANYIAVRKP